MSDSMFPQTVDVVKTRCQGLGVDLVIGAVSDFPWEDAKEFCGMIVQNPDNIGSLTNFTDLFTKLREHDILSVHNADLMSLCIVKSPGEMGADIAVGSAQRFGLPMSFGGPHPGYFAVKDKFKRKMPGRIIGITKD